MKETVQDARQLDDSWTTAGQQLCRLSGISEKQRAVKGSNTKK